MILEFKAVASTIPIGKSFAEIILALPELLFKSTDLDAHHDAHHGVRIMTAGKGHRLVHGFNEFDVFSGS